MPRFTYETVASPLHDPAALAELLQGCRSTLHDIDGAERAHQPDLPHAILVATGGTEAATIAAVEHRAVIVAAPVPALLLAHSRHNSLPAALETLAAIHQRGGRGRIVVLDEADGPARLAEAVEDLAAWHRLHRVRLGLVGTPSEWLVASQPPADVVARRWGPELVEVPIPETISAFEAVPVELGRQAADRFGGTACTTLPAPDDVVSAARLDPALRATIDQFDLDAVTVRCFDFLGQLHTSGCVALAQLNDDGIVAGCEGDVPSALAMQWVRALLDQPAWIANPATVRAGANEIVLAHCTIAPSMVDDVELSTHFESGIGVGVHGRLRAERVTLIRLGGVDLDRCWIAEGTVTGHGDDPDLCRTQATIRLDDTSVTDLLDDPLGNHLVLIEGAHGARLRRWWRWAVADLGAGVGPAR